MAAFQGRLDDFAGEGIRIVGGSVDALDEARGTVQGEGLTYPILHTLPLLETAETLTAFYETRRSILHATGYVVRPDRRIAVVCYSTGPIGRLEPEDVLRAVRFWKKRNAGG